MIGPSNVDALRLIGRWPAWPAPAVLLSGPPGSGKTHLAHIWAAQSGAVILSADRLTKGEAGGVSCSAMVVEDISSEAAPEEPLFHLINAMRESGGSLLLTARAPAEAWRIHLPDLRSRLRMAAPAALGAPDDELLRRVLVKLFADRQLAIDKPVVDYLLARMERSFGAAISIVQAIDRAALAAGRPITRSVAAAILADQPASG